MGWFDIKPVIVINSGGWPLKKPKKVAGVMSVKEIDRLNPETVSGMSREALAALREKLRLTMDELYLDSDPGEPGWALWERRYDKLEAMMDRIDEILDEEDSVTDQEDW